jgi:hypothetical protein
MFVGAEEVNGVGCLLNQVVISRFVPLSLRTCPSLPNCEGSRVNLNQESS